MKKCLSFMIAIVLLASACLIVPVSATETESVDLSEHLVVHYDFNSVGEAYLADGDATAYDIPDVAPGGKSKETLTLTTKGTGVSEVKDGYMHIDSMKSTERVQNYAYCDFDDTKGADIKAATSFTVLFDIEILIGNSSKYSTARNFVDAVSFGKKTDYIRIFQTHMYNVPTVEARAVGSSGNVTSEITSNEDLLPHRAIYALVGDVENSKLAVYVSYDGGKSFSSCVEEIAIKTSQDMLSAATRLSLGGKCFDAYKSTDTDLGIDFNFYDFRFYDTILSIAEMTSELLEQEITYYGTQYKELYTPEGSDATVYDARLIATIDATKSYEKAGFKVYTDDGTNQYDLSSEVTCYYTSVLEWSETESKMVEKTAPDGKRFIVLVVEGIPEGTYPTITVIPWVEANGKTVYANPTVITVTANGIPVLNG